MASSSMSVQLQKLPSPSRWWSRLWRLVVLLVLLVAVVVITIWALTPWMNRWGATDAEVTQSLPGDDLMPAANAQTTRAITIDAPPESVWPWLLQLGVDRGGMYSYDALENLFGLNVHSVNEIVPAYQTLTVGDFVRFTPPDWIRAEGPGFYVMALNPPRSMIACFGMSDEPIEECTTSTWQFVLVPQADGSTRLLLRTRSVANSTVGQAAGAVWQTIPFVMERKMLLGIQERAERFE